MSIIERFGDANVLCVGDVMLDEFTDGVIRRISPESPVPVFLAGAVRTYAGGAANVARNIAALNGRCTVLGVIGDDAAGARLTEALHEAVNITDCLIVSPGRPTTDKVRYVAQGQHVLRVDRETVQSISAALEAEVIARIRREIPSHNVVILSDYAKGMLTSSVARETIAFAQEIGIPVVVDSKSNDFSRFAGATVITPNAWEVEAATGIAAHTDDGVVAAAREALERAGVKAILVTRAEHGMSLVERGHEPVHIRSAAREVFDVVGAGDTVIATLSLLVGLKHPFEDAARIANVAAGISVSRHGTSTVSQGELLEELASATPVSGAPHIGKIMALPEARLRAQAWKAAGKRVAFTNGCFDILHLGHVRLLDFARSSADKLIVGLNDDASIRRLKGPTRPINADTDRAELLAALGAVDGVVLFSQDTPRELIETLVPDVLVKGADYRVEEIVGADFVLQRGGKVLRFDILPDKSTTKVIQKLDGKSA